MTILEEIREGFASMTSYGAMAVNTLPDVYKAYIIRIPDGYGVAIPVDADMTVAESFNSCKFRTGLVAIDGTPSNYLMQDNKIITKISIMRIFYHKLNDKPISLCYTDSRNQV